MVDGLDRAPRRPRRAVSIAKSPRLLAGRRVCRVFNPPNQYSPAGNRRLAPSWRSNGRQIPCSRRRCPISRGHGERGRRLRHRDDHHHRVGGRLEAGIGFGVCFEAPIMLVIGCCDPAKSGSFTGFFRGAGMVEFLPPGPLMSPSSVLARLVLRGPWLYLSERNSGKDAALFGVRIAPKRPICTIRIRLYKSPPLPISTPEGHRAVQEYIRPNGRCRWSERRSRGHGGRGHGGRGGDRWGSLMIFCIGSGSLFADGRERNASPSARCQVQRPDARLEAADLIGESAVGQLAQPLGFGVRFSGHAVG